MRFFHPQSSILHPRFSLPLTSVLCLLTSPLFLSPARADGGNESGIWESRLAERAFASGPAWFSAGPAWLMNALPGAGSSSVRARANALLLERSGDRIPYEADYVGTLSDVSSVSLFDDTSSFARMTGSAITAPNAPLAVFTYIGSSGGAWLTAGNWSPSGPPGTTDVALFTTGNTATSVGINMNGTTNNGANNEAVGEIQLTGGGVNRLIGNSSTSANGTLTLNGVSGVAIQNTTANSLTLQDTAGSGNKLMNVAFGAPGLAIDVTSTGAVTISSIITGANGFTKTGNGTLNLSGANTYIGATIISGGTLVAAVNTLVSTSSVTVNSGGTLLLSGNGRHLGANSDVFLNGGTFNTGGFSEPTTTHTNAAASYIGPLTLQATSTLDLATGSSIIAFTNSSTKTWTGTLNIYNWSGTALLGNGTDQVYFGTDATGLTVAQLNSINFYSDNGTTFLGTGIFAPDLDGEVIPTLVPVPEASTWVGAALALAAVGWTQRKRLRGLLAHRA